MNKRPRWVTVVIELSRRQGLRVGVTQGTQKAVYPQTLAES